MSASEFGRQLLPLWHLDPDATFLNHGSFGAVPREVLAVQTAVREEMERQPDQFFRRRVMPGGGGPDHVRENAAAIAGFAGADEHHVALVENATTAITAVLATRQLSPGDEILYTGHTYNAVRLAIEHAAKLTGAVPRKVEIPIPIRSDDIVERIVDAAGPRTRLAVLDHITSPTAILLPIAEIVRELKRKNVEVLIDGAHAVGHVPLALSSLGADWYTSNAHKWLYAPKGTAFLYAAPGAAHGLIPLAVSHFNHLGFPDCFDYVGTRDVTAWFALPAAIAFVERFGAAKIVDHNFALARRVGNLVAEIGAVPVAPDVFSPAMRAYVLPQRQHRDEDGVALMSELWQRHRIQVAASAFQGKLLLRLSPQIYLDDSDFERLVDVLAREGWPGR